MASQKKIDANRKNAQLSTGPKTTEGKLVSSRNATRHGIYSRDIVIDSAPLKENREDYDNLRQSLFDELRPIGEFEERLVIKIANCLWRSARAIRAETATIVSTIAQVRDNLAHLSPPPSEKDHDQPTPPDLNQSDSPNQLHALTVPLHNAGADILRYEMRLDRQLINVCTLLHHLQHRRQAISLPYHYHQTKK